jgi:hypothetical protein
MQHAATQLREAWLQDAASFLVDYMVKQGLPATAARVSCGWPSCDGLSARMAVIGQCFSPMICRVMGCLKFLSRRA